MPKAVLVGELNIGKRAGCTKEALKKELTLAGVPLHSWQRLQAETTGEQQSGTQPKPLDLKEVVLQRKDASSEKKGLLIKSLPFLVSYTHLSKLS